MCVCVCEREREREREREKLLSMDICEYVIVSRAHFHTPIQELSTGTGLVHLASLAGICMIRRGKQRRWWLDDVPMQNGRTYLHRGKFDLRQVCSWRLPPPPPPPTHTHTHTHTHRCTDTQKKTAGRFVSPRFLAESSGPCWCAQASDQDPPPTQACAPAEDAAYRVQPYCGQPEEHEGKRTMLKMGEDDCVEKYKTLRKKRKETSFAINEKKKR